MTSTNRYLLKTCDIPTVQIFKYLGIYFLLLTISNAISITRKLRHYNWLRFDTSDFKAMTCFWRFERSKKWQKHIEHKNFETSN